MPVIFTLLSDTDFRIDYPRRNSESGPEVVFSRQSSRKDKRITSGLPAKPLSEINLKST